MQRRAKACKGRDTGVKLENHWAMPPAVFDVLRQGLGISKERFASPLNFNPHMDEYWSIHQEDTLFGARHDSFRCYWTGPSEANAEYEHDELFKAMRWAVHSALQQEPSLTLLVHPAWDERSNTAYQRWLDECGEVAQVLVRIPRKNFKFTRPTHWADQDDLAGHPRWDVNFIVTANEQGWERYSTLRTEDGIAQFCEHMADALTGVLQKKVAASDVHKWWKLP